MAIYEYNGQSPSIHTSCYIAELASVIGQVHLAENCSVWCHATLRGDNEPIHIQANTNIQEGAVLHTDMGWPLHIGCHVTVGHQACLHGCNVANNSLIGIGAVVLNGAQIGEQCVVGANTLITEGQVIPPRSLVLGSPGKVVRTLTDAELAKWLNAANYVHKARSFRETLRRLA